MGARQYIRDFSPGCNSKRWAAGHSPVERVLFLLALTLFAVASGCREEPPPPAAPAGPQAAASKLSVLVVNDAGIAAGIKLLRGEWAERTGGELEIAATSVDQLLSSDQLAADLVVYPSRYVGEWVDRGWLRPVRKSVLQNEDAGLDDCFPLIRNASRRYGDNVYALSLGEPPLMFGLTADSTDAEEVTWHGVGNASVENSQFQFPHAVVMLVRGVSYAQNRSEQAALFDADSMVPRITAPPYVKALQELIDSGHAATSPAAGGRIVWPSSQLTETHKFVPLPPAAKVYRTIRKTWEANESTEPVTFLGFAGRSMSVTRASRNSTSAFKLLGWLVGENIASQLSPRSSATLWVRPSQLGKGRWLPTGIRRDEVVSAVNRLLSSENYFLLPRIPMIDDYLKVLDNAISAAVAENRSADEVLTAVAQQWNAITDRHGRSQQRMAYRKHLGLADSSN